jgi:serine/threonine-protein kinase
VKSAEEAHDEIVRRWSELATDAATIEMSPRQTVRPDPSEQSGAGRAVAALSELAARRGAVDADLELDATIGRGGMGVVRSGTQITMGRQVAVKTLRDDVPAPESATLKLLQEAWITGALEHPNIVPVYDVRLDAEGRPHILLKRIGGVVWADLFKDATEVARRFGGEDLLEWNLRVLMQVCNAVHFAHSRGILHRDIKPDNVMIGEFGEVYLVDWGLAVSLRDDLEGRLPHASDARQLAGTPLYMAPEMLGAGGNALSERTDVYLLGATLFEIVTSEPPHQGTTAMQILSKAAVSEPALPTGVPGALGRIVLCAMSRDPADRFESAEQFRLALHGYLHSRGSEQLAAAAEQRLATLVSLVAPPTNRTPEEHRQRCYRVHGEARFGFQQALEAWPDNEAARRGLVRATEVIVEYELGRGDARAAEARLAEIDAPLVELRGRVRDAVHDEDARVDALERLGRDRDAKTGARTRTFVASVAGVVWTVGPLVAAYRTSQGATESYDILLGSSLLYLGLTTVMVYWARESMLRTAINRQILVTGVTVFLSQLVFDAGAMLLGLPVATTIVLHLALWFVISGLGLLTIDRRFALAVTGYLVAFLAAAAQPDVRYYVMAAANALLTVNVVWLWRPLFTVRRAPAERDRARAGSEPEAPPAR